MDGLALLSARRAQAANFARWHLDVALDVAFEVALELVARRRVLAKARWPVPAIVVDKSHGVMEVRDGRNALVNGLSLSASCL